MSSTVTSLSRRRYTIRNTTAQYSNPIPCWQGFRLVTNIRPSTRPGIEPGNYLHLSTAYSPLKQCRGLNLGTTSWEAEILPVCQVTSLSSKTIHHNEHSSTLLKSKTQFSKAGFQIRDITQPHCSAHLKPCPCETSVHSWNTRTYKTWEGCVESMSTFFTQDLALNRNHSIFLESNYVNIFF